MNKLHIGLAALLAVYASLATAQPPAAPAPGAPAMENRMGGAKEPLTEASFVQKAAIGGMFEVQSSELATTASQNDAVKSFAQKMITDHSAAGNALKQLAASKNIPVPATLDGKHSAILQQLSTKKGDEFDKAYGQAQMMGHNMAVNLFRNASTSLTDPDLKAFAAKTLPTLEQHQQLATSLPGADQAKMGGKGKKKKAEE